MTEAALLVDQIMSVMVEAFEPTYREAWNRRQVADALSMPSTHALVVNEQGKLIGPQASDPAGFVLTRHAADEEELLLIAVLPEARGHGIGKALIEYLFDAARARGTQHIFLEMRRGNPAEHLYRKTGFAPIGERPKYYRMINGEAIDAITFGCVI